MDPNIYHSGMLSIEDYNLDTICEVIWETSL